MPVGSLYRVSEAGTNIRGGQSECLNLRYILSVKAERKNEYQQQHGAKFGHNSSLSSRYPDMSENASIAV